MRRDAMWQQRAKARAAGEAALAKYLTDRKAELKGKWEGNLAAFKGGTCSEWCERAEGLHGIGYPVAYATDCNPETYWAADHPPQWLQVDLGKVETISKVRITNYFGDARYYHYRVEVSQEGMQWTEVGEKINDGLATAEGDLYEFGAMKARYVKITMVYNSNNWGQHVVEVGVWR